MCLALAYADHDVATPSCGRIGIVLARQRTRGRTRAQRVIRTAAEDTALGSALDSLDSVDAGVPARAQTVGAAQLERLQSGLVRDLVGLRLVQASTQLVLDGWL